MILDHILTVLDPSSRTTRRCGTKSRVCCRDYILARRVGIASNEALYPGEAGLNGHQFRGIRGEEAKIDSWEPIENFLKVALPVEAVRKALMRC